ncbi:MAG: hypothetical protein RQ751_09120 [Longimicrobiales bacterium]|nr:hypothetical protein [Longimicrobiales bacterium]
MIRRALRFARPALALALPALLAGPVAGQRSALVAEVGASRFLPPVGVEGEAASYLLVGLRGDRLGSGGSGVTASLLAGWASGGGTGGDFLSGEVAGLMRTDLGRGWEVGGEVRASAFTVGDPVPYRAGALEGEAFLRARAGPVRATVAGTGGVGRSTVELRRFVRGPSVEVTDDLWRYGARAEVLAGSAAVAAGLAAGYHESAGGSYGSLGGRLAVGVAGGALEFRLDVWDTPVGNETTGGVALAIPFGIWSVRGFGGRSEPDPLTLAEPGRGGGGALVGVRLTGSDDARTVGAVSRGRALHRVLEATPAGARVRFTLPAPDGIDGTDEVALLGDFTLWSPVPMERAGAVWTVEVEVPAGTHHFGFTLDGEWHLPEDAPDAVPDEWGRRSATLVVED